MDVRIIIYIGVMLCIFIDLRVSQCLILVTYTQAATILALWYQSLKTFFKLYTNTTIEDDVCTIAYTCTNIIMVGFRVLGIPY